MGPAGPLTGRGVEEVACERRVTLETAVNFRDLGGYRAADGRTVRWRRLFRADDLSGLTEPDRSLVRTLGIATVIDLRSRAEVDLQRFPVDEIPVDFHHLPLVAALPRFEDFLAGPGFFSGHYLDIARDSGPQIARAVEIVADARSHPAVVHCAAGKDRTGVLVAVLLALLGVTDDTIAQDYALSAEAMDGLLARILARMPEQEAVIRDVAAAMFSATPANIAALLDGLRAEHGTVEAYVRAHGAGPDVIGALRGALLEPAR